MSGRGVAKPALVSLWVPAAVVALDQWSKAVVQRALEIGERHALVDGLLFFTHHVNTGAAFGILSGEARGLLAISMFFIIGMGFYLLREKRKNLPGFAFLLILAGAIGNAADRIRLGHVVDFIGVWRWPVFNIADSAITLGVLLAGWSLLRERRKGLFRR